MNTMNKALIAGALLAAIPLSVFAVTQSTQSTQSTQLENATEPQQTAAQHNADIHHGDNNNRHILNTSHIIREHDDSDNHVNKKADHEYTSHSKNNTAQ